MNKFNILLLFLLSSVISTAQNIYEDKSIDLANRSNRVLQRSGDISLPPNSVSISNLFTISFEFKPVGFITMAIKFKIPNQFFGIGFGTGMVGSDIWVFQIINSELVVSDRIAISHSQPKLDTSQGGIDDIQMLGYEISSSYSLAKVRRKLNTGDPNDAIISEGLVNMIYATTTSPTVTYHGKTGRGIVVVPMISGTEEFTTEDTSLQGKMIIENAHSLVNLIVWGAIADIAIIMVRLLRGRKMTFGNTVIPTQGIHAVMMVFVIMISTVVTSLILNQNRKERGFKLLEINEKDFHFINGLILLALIFFAVVSGCITLASLKTYHRRTNSIYIMKMGHRVAGVIIYLQAKANIITGVLSHEEGKWKVGVYIYLGILLIVHVGLQVMHWYFGKYSNISAENLHKDEHHSLFLIEAINRGVSREELIRIFPNIKWVILGNSIYDLTGWIHPGGNFIIETCIGYEVGRYFYGNYALEGTKIKAHQHSALTIKQLKRFYIGEVLNYESIFCLKKGEKNTVSKSTDQWRITRITPISDTVSEVSFRNTHFQVKKFGKSLSWLGRNFRVSFDRNDSPARLYSTALSLTKGNTQLRENIYVFFDEVMSGNKTTTFSYEFSTFSSFNCVSLFIKNYRAFNGLSNAIHHVRVTTLTNKFRVEGPFGRGLELTPKSSGTHCIICSGTGIFPFIDYLNMFLWKTMYQLIKDKAGIKKAELINPYKIPFDTLCNGMILKFIGAFPTTNDILGLDIIKKLAEISKKYNLNNFQALIKGYSDENIIPVNGDFSSFDFLSKHVTTKESKFYVVGPPKFNEEVPRTLRLLGIPKNRILLV